ncbi:MAG TPA: methyltransferase [Casimicrobiaceae bacterium]|jgi:predicted methyltransferase|nr:methyltransferase [Casimicrobiaceae bacterium]
MTVMPALLRAVRAVAVVLVAAGCATQPAQPTLEQRAQAVIASPIRTDQDRRMDASRKPAQFLPFTGVTAGMVVLDVSAGAGYTSQLLALCVGPEGKLFAQRPAPGEALTKRLAEHPQPNFIPVYRPFDDPVPPDAPKLDLVTLVNNYHDIVYQPIDRARMNQRLYAALKPGGHFVIVDHSAKAGTGVTVAKTLHRIDRDVVVQEVTRAGFVLEAEAQFMRNPSDTREVSSGDGRIDTDKFVLRFVKPG